MEGVQDNIPVVFTVVDVGVKLFGIVTAVALYKSQQVDLVAEICLEPLFISFYFFDKHIQNSF